MVKITIDKNLCIGCGSCAAICPSSFKMKDGKAVPVKIESDDDCVEEAKNSCPTGAIMLE